MNKFQHKMSRLLAGAVAAGCAVASAPSLGFTVQITGAPAGTTCQSASIDSQNNVTINCSSSTTPPPTTPPPPSSPPPPDQPISCNIPGITKVKTVQLSWQTLVGTGFNTAKAVGGQNPGDAVVFIVTPPKGTSTNGGQGYFKFSPTDGSAYNFRIVSVSTSPCDYSGSLGRGSILSGQQGNLYFTVGGRGVDKYGRVNMNVPDLVADGRSYYFTVINQQSVGGANTCSYNACNINFGLAPGI